VLDSHLQNNSRKEVAWCTEVQFPLSYAEFIEPKKNWLPISPDLNPTASVRIECCNRWCIITEFQTMTDWNVC